MRQCQYMTTFCVREDISHGRVKYEISRLCLHYMRQRAKLLSLGNLADCDCSCCPKLKCGFRTYILFVLE